MHANLQIRDDSTRIQAGMFVGTIKLELLFLFEFGALYLSDILKAFARNREVSI